MRRIVPAVLGLLLVSFFLVDGLDARGRRGRPALVDPDIAEAVRPLVEKLDDPSFRERERATQALMELGPAARPALIPAANHLSAEVRARIRRILLHYREVERQRDLGPESRDEWPEFKRGPGRRASMGLEAIRAEPKVKWHRFLEQPVGMPYFDSPLLATADRVYAVSRSGEVTAIDRESGELVWRKRTGERVFAGPVLAGDTIYVPGLSLTAMDTASGAIRWRWKTDYGVSAPPLVADGRVYAVERGEKLVALDPATGAEQWKWRMPATASTPLRTGDLLVIGAGDGLRACSPDKGSRRWHVRTEYPVVASAAVFDGTIVFGDEGRNLYAVTADKGKRVWQRRLPEGALRVVPVVYGDALFFSTTSGSFRAVRAADGGDLWIRNVGSYLQSSPCVAGGVVCFTAGTRLHAMECASGDDVWRLDLLSAFSSPILLNGTLYIASVDGVVVAFEQP